MKTLIALLFVVSLIVGGCSFLPKAGPYSRQINSDTKTLKIAAVDKKNRPLYYLAKLSSNRLIPFISQRNDFYATTSDEWKSLASSANVDMGINIGDELEIVVFETAQDGLFLAKNTLANSGKFTTLPAQFVDNEGYISIPYAGRVKVAGKTLFQAKLAITGLLIDKAIEPQVLVKFVNRRGANVSVLGEVNTSARYQLGFQRENVLDVIASAGGTIGDGRSAFITLLRKNVRAVSHLDRLVEDPNLNVRILPGDTLYLSTEPAMYTLHGATVSTGIFSFPQKTISMIEALSLGGGLDDIRANPSKVYVYRMENIHHLKLLGFDVEQFDTEKTILPVIYQIDLSEVDGVMNANNFSIENKDILYVANAASVELNKFISILDPSATAVTNTRNAINDTDN